MTSADGTEKRSRDCNDDNECRDEKFMMEYEGETAFAQFCGRQRGGWGAPERG